MDDRFREEAYHRILGNEFFLPQGEMKDHIVSAITVGEATTVRYSDLQVKTEGCSEHYGYIEAGDRNTDGEKQLFSAVYGTENPGDGKRIYLLKENVVKSQLEGKAENVVALACYLDGSQGFLAIDWSIYGHGGAVRGVRCVVSREAAAPADESVPNAPLEMTPAHHYDALLVADREKALADLTPARAAGLSELLTAYLAAKAQ